MFHRARLETPLVLVLALAASLAASGEPAPKAPIGLADLHRVRSAQQVAIARDGSAIAFTVQVPRLPWTEDDGPAWVELHVAEKGRPARPFVSGAVNVSRIAFGPDGAEVFFVAKRKGEERAALFSIRRDGGEARRRLSFATDVEGYALAPKGGLVAFLAREKKPEALEAREKKGFNQEVFEESWRPVRVWLARLDGEEPPRALDLPGSASEPSFSPAGDRLAVALAPTPSVDDGYMARKVHVVSLEGKVLGRVAHEGKLGHVAWSPDGSRLAMSLFVISCGQTVDRACRRSGR